MSIVIDACQNTKPEILCRQRQAAGTAEQVDRGDDVTNSLFTG